VKINEMYQSQNQTGNAHKALIRAFVDAINAQDWDKLDELVAYNFVRYSYAAGAEIHFK
jgi:hypothetical protein